MDTIYDRFVALKDKDKKYVRKFLTEWHYQLINRKRKLTLPVESVGDYMTYNGPGDLINWMKWINIKAPNIFGQDFIHELSLKALERDKGALQKLGLEFNFENYDSSIGLFNVFDYKFPQCYPIPNSRKIRNILDFGAGYGRQANLWTIDQENKYVGMDGIAKSYTLQNMYYNAISSSVSDYIDNPETFSIENNKNQILHLPTWRYDLLPDIFFDLVICVQVLPELESKLVKTMVRQFSRTLKPGGMLYICDHGKKWKPGGNMDIDRFILDNGFVIEFKPYLADLNDMHGEIRIYRKEDAGITMANKPTFKSNYNHFYAELDALTSGMVSKIVKIKKKYFK